jgi:iron complex transport system substrate-binding protein
VDYLYIDSPWPGASKTFRYALVPRGERDEKAARIRGVDGVIGLPALRVITTSTTHIPALESLGVPERLVGFPGLKYISSPTTRERMEKGEIEELGANEALNTELAVALDPDLVVGFGVSGTPGSYEALEASGIPVVYNGDWMEEDPLGKAEWILFFGILLGKEDAARKAFEQVESAYLEARALAAKAGETPTVLSGALYRDVWYLPGGDSWAARIIQDANARYLWADVPERGSLSLSLESVLEKGAEADFWIAPSQYTSYREMADAEIHYRQFRAFREQQVYTYARTRGPGEGLWYYELGPSRPDMVLKDLIHCFHPGLLPGYEPFFFKPLE